MKKCWPIISGDFIALVNEFHAGTAQLENLSEAFITLIPKKLSKLLEISGHFFDKCGVEIPH